MGVLLTRVLLSKSVARLTRPVSGQGSIETRAPWATRVAQDHESQTDFFSWSCAGTMGDPCRVKASRRQGVCYDAVRYPDTTPDTTPAPRMRLVIREAAVPRSIPRM